MGPEELDTVPVPVPARLTFKVLRVELKVAVTLRVEVMDTVHVFPTVESHPSQLVKVEPASAVAVRVTFVPVE